jgi:hypothetical protein
MRMFPAGSVTETVLVVIAFAVSIRPVLMRAAVVNQVRRCAISLQPPSRRAARSGPAPRWRTADSWRAGGGVARTM